MTSTDRCSSLVSELYAEAAEFLRPAAERGSREEDRPADAARSTRADCDGKESEPGGEHLAAH